MTKKLVSVGLGLCVAAGSAVAQQTLYSEVTDTHLPNGLAGPCMDSASGDADGDGDLDLALAMEFQPNVLLLNDGAGVFTNASSQLPRAAHDSEDIAFADFDADGDLDLAIVSEDDEIDELYLNDGRGRFTDASDRLRRAPANTSNALAVLDLNNDGAPDLLTGNIGTDLALVNDGRANFTDDTARRWPQTGDSRTQDLELVDVDNDDDLDVVVANEGQDQLFLNDGEGRLIDATDGQLPRRDDESREIKAADVDNDGDMDLIVANVQFVFRRSRQDYLLLNDGSGSFTDAEPARLPDDDRDNFTIQVVDLDLDGDIDILAPSTVFDAAGAGDYRVLLNDGAGYFSVAAPGSVLPATANGNGFDIEVADFNRDGRDDLFFCNRSSSSSNPRTAAASGGLQRLLFRNPP